MDSANSGSIQSSSGGDEEYDSRADSISALFHPTSSSSAAAALLPLLLLPSHVPRSALFKEPVLSATPSSRMITPFPS
ncbi:hypothetical protein COCNU_scaffold001054G000070 [Cocos nucifera]|nr:hypothetical protein [Cocos nucifera]